MFGWFTNRRRAKLLAQPAPKNWMEVLTESMPLYRALPAEDQQELIDLVKVLMSEKEFIGAHEFFVTEEMKVLICAQAAVLMLHRTPTYFPNVRTIIVYASSFASTINERMGQYLYLEKYQPRLGESDHRTKTVVLAWDSVIHGAANPYDGKNVVLHEFAHQLDSEDGFVNGAPILSSNSAYRAWAKEMTKEFDHLQEKVSNHQKTFVDHYGATNPAEYFAVMTETFFEKPKAFQRKLPQLYDLFVDFYQQDPAKLEI